MTLPALALLVAIAIPAWPRGELEGELATRGGEVPTVIELQLWPATRSGEHSRGEPLAVISCPVSQGRWQCPAPLADLDIRMVARGLAPAYFWNVRFENGVATLPRTTLEAGASLGGWVVGPDGQPAPGAKVRLAPAQVNETAGRLSGLALQGVTEAVNDRGFFQFSALAAGDYSVAAHLGDGATTPPVSVSIAEAREYLLESALELQAPSTVDLRIDPVHTAGGSPWTVHLDRVLTKDQMIVEAKSGAAGQDGRWLGEQIPRGAYRLRIVDDSGSTVARQDIEIDREFVPVTITVGRVPIRGRARFGNDPVAATLKFESAAGTVRIRSDEDGEFTGSLPKDGTWRVEITPTGALQRVRTQVEVKTPSDGGPAKVDIDLPGHRIEGIVTDEDGDPVSEAEILVFRSNAVAANAGSGHSGEFRILGVETGPVVLVAKKGERTSERYPHVVSESASPEVTLMLRAPAEISGRLVRPGGRPLVGALIRYVAGGEVRSTVSGPAGEFALTVPPGTSFADAAVIAPHTPVKLERIEASRGDRVIVVSDIPAVLNIRLPNASNLPSIRRGAAQVPISLLFHPREGFGPPRELLEDGLRLEVEPGDYLVCYPGQGECIAANAGGK